MILDVKLIGDRNLIRNLDQLPPVVRSILYEKMVVLTDKVASQAQLNIGLRLNKNSLGRLKSRVETTVINSPTLVEGHVFIDGVPYAKIQEEGGVTQPHVIYPRKGKFLVFRNLIGKLIFTTRVFHPGGVIPATWYMRDAKESLASEISKTIKGSVIRGIRESMRR